jgi:hypothetical protein
MASSTPERLWVAPRVAKEREILFEAIANGSVVSWQDISPAGGIRFLGRKRLRDWVRIKRQNWMPEVGLIFGAAKSRVSLCIRGLCQISWRFTYLCWKNPQSDEVFHLSHPCAPDVQPPGALSPAALPQAGQGASV